MATIEDRQEKQQLNNKQQRQDTGKLITHTVLDINMPNHAHRTALHLTSMCTARSSENTAIFNDLLRHKADVLRIDGKGYNCLHMACDHNQLDIVDTLVNVAHMNLESRTTPNMQTGICYCVYNIS